VVDDLAAVFRELVIVDGEVAVGDAGLDFRRDRYLPEMGLLVVLVVGVDVVFLAFARLFVGGFRIGGLEVNRAAVRRPRQLGDCRRVRRQLARFTTVDWQQINLRRVVVAAFGSDRAVLPVARPARSLLAVGPARELHGLAAADRRPP